MNLEATPRVRRAVLTLARSERLTVYDAVDLEPAVRRGQALACLDEDLRKAAQRQGVPVRP